MIDQNLMDQFMKLTGGWLIEEENFGELDALEGERQVLAMQGHFDPTAAKYNARDVIRTENQSKQGACQGHAISTVLEWCSCIAIGKKSVELSRAMGYYDTQRGDKIKGDRGSTISGGVRLAMNTGICQEKFWPYPNRYDNTRPHNYKEVVLPSAKRFRAGKMIRIESWNGLMTFLDAGLGGVTVGIPWNKSVNREHVTSFCGGGGGHAIAVPQRSRKRPEEADMNNSWDKRWGDDGWATWNQKAVEGMLRHKHTVMIGVSDMTELEPRTITFTEFMEDMTLFG